MFIAMFVFPINYVLVFVYTNKIVREYINSFIAPLEITLYALKIY